MTTELLLNKLIVEKNKIIEEQDEIIYQFFKYKNKKTVFWLCCGIFIGGVSTWLYTNN